MTIRLEVGPPDPPPLEEEEEEAAEEKEVDERLAKEGLHRSGQEITLRRLSQTGPARAPVAAAQRRCRLSGP